MELHNLHTIVDGLESLSAIEKEHPVLGKQLFNFVTEVSECCDLAYNRLSRALGNVRNLSSQSTKKQVESVATEINEAPDSKWFKEVAGICNQLAVLASRHQKDFSSQLEYTSPFGDNWKDSHDKMTLPRYSAHYKIAPLFSLLEKQERQLKDDIRDVVSNVQSKLGDAKDSGNFQDVRNYALEVQKEISQSLDEIKQISYQLKGTSKDGATIILTPEKIAENALRRPERILILNMFFILVTICAGATIFQYLQIYQFILVTGFSITVVIVLNAFYLKTIDKLSEESFLKLIQLALLKFFAPITKSKS
jgi:hypothetical protein